MIMSIMDLGIAVWVPIQRNWQLDRTDINILSEFSGTCLPCSHYIKTTILIIIVQAGLLHETNH